MGVGTTSVGNRLRLFNFRKSPFHVRSLVKTWRDWGSFMFNNTVHAHGCYKLRRNKKQAPSHSELSWSNSQQLRCNMQRIWIDHMHLSVTDACSLILRVMKHVYGLSQRIRFRVFMHISWPQIRFSAPAGTAGKVPQLNTDQHWGVNSGGGVGWGGIQFSTSQGKGDTHIWIFSIPTSRSFRHRI